MGTNRESEKFEQARTDFLKTLGRCVLLAADAGRLRRVYTRQEIRARVQALEDGVAALVPPFVSSHQVGFDSVPEIAIDPFSGDAYFVGVVKSGVLLPDTRSHVYRVGRVEPQRLPGQSDSACYVSELHFPENSREPVWLSFVLSEKKVKALLHWGRSVIDLGPVQTNDIGQYHKNIHTYESREGQRLVVDLSPERREKRRWRFAEGQWQEDSISGLGFCEFISGHIVSTKRDDSGRGYFLRWILPDGTEPKIELPLMVYCVSGFAIRGDVLCFAACYKSTRYPLTEDSLYYGEVSRSGRAYMEERVPSAPLTRDTILSSNGRLVRVGFYSRQGAPQGTVVIDLKTGLQFGGNEQTIKGSVYDMVFDGDTIKLLVGSGGSTTIFHWQLTDGVLSSEEIDKTRVDVCQGEPKRFFVAARHLYVTTTQGQDGIDKKVVFCQERRPGGEHRLRNIDEALTWVECENAIMCAHFAQGTIFIRAYRAV